MSKRVPSRVLEAVLGQPWAITVDAYETILTVLQRENPDPQTIAAEIGVELDNTRTVTVRNNVATIPIMGPLVPRADFFSEVSGLTAMEAVARDFTTALEDDEVGAILLAMDSPGGTAAGTAELAELIREARGVKPVIAQVTDMAASAAFWIATAADEVVTTTTGVLGSVGVIHSFIDDTEAMAQRGFRRIDVVSSRAPKKRADPTTKEGRAQIQETLDDLEAAFIDALVHHRGVSEKTVVEQFGQGDVVIGRKALKANMADRIATFEQTHARLERMLHGESKRQVTVFAGLEPLPARASHIAAACYEAGLLPRLAIGGARRDAQLNVVRSLRLGRDATDALAVSDRDVTDVKSELSDGQNVANVKEDRMSTDNAATKKDVDSEALVAAERERASTIRSLAADTDFPAERIDALIASGADVPTAQLEILKHVKAGVKAIAISGVHDRAEDESFSNIGATCIALARATRGSWQNEAVDARLRPLMATGQSEAVPSEGGVFVSKQQANDMRTAIMTEGSLLARVANTPIGAGANGIKRNLIDEKSRVDGSRAGGVRGYWVNEGVAPTKSSLKFRPMEMSLEKVAAVLYATEEQLQDDVALASDINREVPNELRFKAEDAIYNGDGAAKPLGFMQSPALKTVAAETGQTAASELQAKNFANMYSSMPPRSISTSVWLINNGLMPELLTSGITFGTGGQSLFMPAGFQGLPFNSILGRPVIPVEYAAAANTTGDITFVDPSRYELIEKGGIRPATSIHVQFLTDETTFRFTWRINGQTIDHSVITPFKGSFTISPFVALATRT